MGAKGKPSSKRYDNVSLLAKAVRFAMTGKSKTDCFRLIGIHPDTGHDWLRRGRSGEPEILVRFERIFEKAYARYNAEKVDMINQAAQSGQPNTWQAAAWLLERRDPSNWGRRDTTKIEGGDAPLLQLNVAVLSDANIRADGRALLRRVAGAGTDLALGPGLGDEPEDAGQDGEEPVAISVDSREAR